MADGAGEIRGLRADTDTEAAVLCACLIDHDVALEMADRLSPDVFYSDANRFIFEAIRDIARDGARVEAVLVLGRLRDGNRLDRVGGAPYIAQLADATPAISNAGRHADRLEGLARLRAARAVVNKLRAALESEDIPDAAAWLGRAEEEFFRVASGAGRESDSSVSYGDLLRRAEQMAREAFDNPRPVLGWTTGFRDIDEHLGGLHNGQLVIVAGRTGMGKTTLADQMAVNVAADETNPGAVVEQSLEMPKDLTAVRAMAREARLPQPAIRHGRPGEHGWDAMASAIERRDRLPLELDDRPTLSALGLRAAVRRNYAKIRKRSPGVPLALVVVDYLQLMQTEQRRGAHRAELVGELARSLKLMAREMSCCVLALSQVRRVEKSERAKPPSLEDLKESGDIENHADVVLAIHRPDYYKPNEPPDGLAEVHVLKGRMSGGGVHRLKWNGVMSRLDNDDGAADQMERDFNERCGK